MKELTVLAWCDNDIAHGKDKTKTPATEEIEFTVNGSKPHVLDLCRNCDGHLGETLRTALRLAHEVQVKRRKRRARAETVAPETHEYRCPRRGCGRTFYAQRGLSQHLTKSHGG